VLLVLAIILLFVLPSPWNALAAVIGITLFIGELFFWQHRVKHWRGAVGAETMMGKEATVVTPCTPLGQVRIGGEIWSARCAEGAGQGETVRVVGIDDITLQVERVTTGDAE
jgi:membrane protein implicated in regulation of membrane protease activity